MGFRQDKAVDGQFGCYVSQSCDILATGLSIKCVMFNPSLKLVYAHAAAVMCVVTCEGQKIQSIF